MTDLIKAVDALAEVVVNQNWEALDTALAAYRQARESADGVMVEELADAMAQELNGGFIDSATWYNGSQKDLWLQRSPHQSSTRHLTTQRIGSGRCVFLCECAFSC